MRTKVAAAATSMLVVVAVIAASPPAAIAKAIDRPSSRSAAPLPTLTGVEFRELYNLYEPVPGSEKLTSPPPITGNDAADKHIRAIAIRRGYRMRSQHTGTLITALGVPVDKVAGAQLNALAGRASADGYRLGASYGYRSSDLQRTLFMQHLSGYTVQQIINGQADGAIDTTLRRTAAPGYSKHQSGMTLDLRAVGGSGGTFAGSGVGQWMAANNYQHAKEYGFIPSYPPGAGLQGPEPEPWEYVYVGRKAIECAAPLVRRHDRVGFESCMGTSAIARKYAQLGGPGGILGPVTTAEKANSDGRGRVARYQKGNLYWTPTTGAHEVRAPILTEFGERGSVTGALRYPTSDTLRSSDHRSTYNNFERGRIYNRGTTVLTVPSPYFAKHEAFGGVHGVLGYPTSSVRASEDGRSQYQDYESGRIYVRSSRATEIHGAVLTLHQTLGGPAGPLGYPASDLGTVGDGRGKGQWFERGMVFYSPATGAHGLWGGILERFAANGGAMGYLRYPISEPTAVGDGTGTYATFERGRIYGTGATGSHEVHGGVLTAYLDNGGPTGSLGYPTSELSAADSTGGRVQTFQGGQIRVESGGTVHIVT